MTMIRTALVVATTLAFSGCTSPSSNTESTAVTKVAKGLAVTLKNVEVSHDIGPSGLIPTAPTGVTYVLVNYSLKNTGDEALSLDKWPQALLVDPKGHELERELMNSTMLSAMANPSWAETLTPSLSTDATAVWKIDEKAFNRATWTLAFEATPKITFRLQ